MIGLEIIGSMLVLGAIGAFSQGWSRLGFWGNITSSLVWALVAVDASLWGLLGLQAGIAFLAARGLWRCRVVRTP